jgi:DNA-binding NarL/FixJ family response regulator
VKPITVLLVDDISDLRKLLRLVLNAEQDIEVIGESQDGREAIACARKHQPGIVVLDLNMPLVNGLQALPRILEVSPQSRVIVMSGFDSIEVEKTARELGAWAYIEKGLDITNIVRAIREVAAAPAPDGSGA